ncbi:MAG: amidohydrolase/deacetylase family metallohydrolase [Bryobacteraceae bacterium]|nr:amidohydrolase/deacetylase family metallohydrolase [Bryobacteraceae bacterium]MDW8379882.1 amidohydrolase/deacetylase family metallohydrolase [Bryobacterales bacterium]
MKFAFFLAAVSLARPAEIYDLLLRNGYLLDPASGRKGRMDVAVVGTRIAKIAPHLPASHARLLIDASEYYVTPGLIDLHTHFDATGADLNLNPDHNALRFCVTTAVDAGSSGADNFEAFRRNSIDRAKIRLLAFLDISPSGMYKPELATGPTASHLARTIQVVNQNRDVIVGVKASSGLNSVKLAVQAAAGSGTIAMVDLHSPHGASYRDLLLHLLRPGDLFTHIYSRSVPLLDHHKKIAPHFWEARKRGILFDVGHGSSGFWFRIAAPAIAQGFLPDTISSDLDKQSVALPQANMTHTLSKFLNLGLTLEQVIERATRNPAQAIRRPHLGTLREGGDADIAILKLESGTFAFLDSGHAKLTGSQRLRCAVAIRQGKVLWDEDGLSLGDVSQAGPYSNFK